MPFRRESSVPVTVAIAGSGKGIRGPGASLGARGQSFSRSIPLQPIPASLKKNANSGGGGFGLLGSGTGVGTSSAVEGIYGVVARHGPASISTVDPGEVQSAKCDPPTAERSGGCERRDTRSPARSKQRASNTSSSRASLDDRTPLVVKEQNSKGAGVHVSNKQAASSAVDSRRPTSKQETLGVAALDDALLQEVDVGQKGASNKQEREHAEVRDYEAEDLENPYENDPTILTQEKLQLVTGYDDLDLVNYLEMQVDTNVTNVDTLGELMPGLVTLRLSGSIVPTARYLGKYFNRLRILYLSHCGLADLSGIHTCHQLTELYLSFNDISSLSPLYALYNLEVVDCEGNMIADIDELGALTQCTDLRCLSLEGNPVQVATSPENSSTEDDPNVSTVAAYRRKVAEYLPQVEVLDDFDIAISDPVVEQRRRMASAGEGGEGSGDDPLADDLNFLKELAGDGTGGESGAGAGNAAATATDIRELQMEAQLISQSIKSTRGMGLEGVIEQEHRGLNSRQSASGTGARQRPPSSGGRPGSNSHGPQDTTTATNCSFGSHPMPNTAPCFTGSGSFPNAVVSSPLKAVDTASELTRGNSNLVFSGNVTQRLRQGRRKSSMLREQEALLRERYRNRNRTQQPTEGENDAEVETNDADTSLHRSGSAPVMSSPSKEKIKRQQAAISPVVPSKPPTNPAEYPSPQAQRHKRQLEEQERQHEDGGGRGRSSESSSDNSSSDGDGSPAGAHSEADDGCGPSVGLRLMARHADAAAGLSVPHTAVSNDDMVKEITRWKQDRVAKYTTDLAQEAGVGSGSHFESLDMDALQVDKTGDL